MNLPVLIVLINYLLIIFILHIVTAGKEVYSSGFKYFVSYPMKKNWYQAQRYCTYHGMYLVDIVNQAENTRLCNIIDDEMFANETNLFFWTSGTDLGSENSFYWASTGHPVLYSDWYMGQPDNSGNDKETDNCIEIRKHLDSKWNDDLCSELKYFICRDTILLPDTKKLTCDAKVPKTQIFDVRSN